MDTLSEPFALGGPQGIQFLIHTKLLKRTGARLGKRVALLDLSSGADVVQLRRMGFNAVGVNFLEVDELPPADVVLLRGSLLG
ncbi:MAG: hypothetical protein HC921_21820 [Synechococcaceae cyanobacterium SM2_3_1]|nr:hypothetical protein [Synechococcaceae cyanobacterium SM2_3_1]